MLGGLLKHRIEFSRRVDYVSQMQEYAPVYTFKTMSGIALWYQVLAYQVRNMMLVVVVIVVAVIILPHTGAGALGRSEKPLRSKIRLRSTTLPTYKVHETKK